MMELRKGPASPRTDGAPARVADRIRSVVPALNASEARVARSVLADPQGMIYKSISQLADEAGTAVSTVVRFCKRLGFHGYQDLKIALARESLPATARIQGSVQEGDSPATVLDKVVSAGVDALAESLSAVNRDSFAQLVGLLEEARRVLFVAVGTSQPLAADAAYRFTTIGVRAECIGDAHHQHVAARLLSANDLCLAISHTGSTNETLAAVGAARRAGARTAAVTSFSRSPLTELVDVTLIAGSREVSFRVEAMTSRIVHLTVLDALLVTVALRTQPRAGTSLDLTAEILTEHRY